jgi:citrate synthase
VQIRTALTHIADGRPYFRGYPLTDLIQRASIAEIAFMAFKHKDASHDESFQFRKDFNYCGREFAPPEAVLKASSDSYSSGTPVQVAVSTALLMMPEPDPVKLPKTIAANYSTEQACALMLAPQVINIVAHLFGHRISWDSETTIQTAVFMILAGKVPKMEEREILRAMMAACIDHTPATPSSLAAISCYSGGNSLKTALSAGISSMGDTHAGAGEGAAKVLGETLARFREGRKASTFLEADGIKIKDIGELADYLVDKMTGVYGGEKRRIPGYGHRYYSLYGCDPRAVALLQTASELGVAGRHCKLAKAVQESLQEKKSPGLCLNVDGAIGALLCDVGLPAEAGKPIFVIPRTIGILAQLLEQNRGAFFRLSNDSIIYIGPERSQQRRFE